MAIRATAKRRIWSPYARAHGSRTNLAISKRSGVTTCVKCEHTQRQWRRSSCEHTLRCPRRKSPRGEAAEYASEKLTRRRKDNFWPCLLSDRENYHQLGISRWPEPGEGRAFHDTKSNLLKEGEKVKSQCVKKYKVKLFKNTIHVVCSQKNPKW